MGRNSSNRKKKALRRNKTAALPQIKSLTSEELLSIAQDKIDSFQYEEAQLLCREVLQRNSDHVPALEISGHLCIETKNFDGAKHCYGRAIHLKPDDGYRKYLVMGQLLDGNESCQCYLKGIELMKSELKLKTDKLLQNGETSTDISMDKEEKENESLNSQIDNDSKPSSSKSVNPNVSSNNNDLNREISSAYCSVSELYMTDLCDEEEAENNCIKYSKLSIESDPTNPEAHQQMANFYLVKQEIEEAKTHMKKSIDLWLPKYLSVDDGEAEGGTFDPIEVCPLSYDARMSSARLLIELELHELASDVLETLVGEDDEVVDMWYLLGLNNFLMGEEHYSNAKENFVKAKELHKKNPCTDEQVLEHINEMLEKIGDPPEPDVEDEVDEEFLNADSDNESMECS